MLKRTIFVCLFFAAAATQAANWPEHPLLHAVRVTAAPALDGDLSDAAWQAAPEFTSFTQHEPDDGQPPTMPTSIRIVYDDEAIYFGAKMTDPRPPTALLARRDTFTPSDFLSLNIDPQLDRLSGSSFTVTPANTQLDSILYNDIIEDGSWDGVWASATKVTADGWSAEIRIPFSQLRFPDRPSHVWGLNITRRTVRNNEWVRIVNTRKGGTGFVSHFADIVGLEGIHRGKPLELVPYAVTRADVRTRADRNNPLLDRREARADAGLDLKYALTSSLTITGTINPDFGQVEVDPAVVNLSQFETFYPEKRPFFTEGVNIFRFADTPAPSHFTFFFSPTLFYTRRIGRSPQVRPDADYIDSPSDTTILGAAKLTGKLGNGWSVGVLDALTDKENARFVSDSGTRERQQVEPLTNYFVARMTKALAPGARLGFMLTSVDRKLSEDESSSLRGSAVTGGIDGYASFGANRSWIVEGDAVGSHVTGSADAIAATQRSSSRYYQRPDTTSVHYDPTRTSLDGWGGRAMISKTTGLWRPNVQVHVYSPGFETNDTGFMQRTDIVSAHALMQYVSEESTAHFRSKTLWFGTWRNSNFDGVTLERGIFADHSATLKSYWTYHTSLFLTPDAFSDRTTRGGPVVRTAGGYSSDLSLGTDDRKVLSAEASAHLEGSRDGSNFHTVALTLTARPASNVQLSAGPAFTRSHDENQYVTAFADPAAAATYGRRYVFAELEQHSFELATRVDWTLSSRLSLQLYLQPFIATGDYHDYHALVAARTRSYTPYTHPVSNDDFNFRSMRGSAVARWEFRPGSALYVVWNENRAGVTNLGEFHFGRDLRAIPNAPSQDAFLIKVSYWIPF